MMIKHSLLLLLLLTSCTTAKIVSQPEPIQTPDFINRFPGPPAVGSPEAEVDHQALLHLQKTRTAHECARAATEVKISLQTYYAKPYGSLTKKQMTELAPFFERVSDPAWKLIDSAKKKWKRVRPYDAFSDVHPCISKERSFSYPSGHSAISRYYYKILVRLYPEKQKELLKRSDQIATDRTIGGVHYVTDVRDGKRLGEEVYDYLVANENLDQLIDEFKSTLRSKP
jgi:acid phosphatase (class A)